MRVYHLSEDLPWQAQNLGGRRFGKSVCVQRYGGFGDMLQVSSIMPGLKEQGYFVTLNTTEQGYDVIRNDPHIDAVLLQKDGQVPNQELGYYWTALAENFDKFIMLSEYIEGALLALPERREAMQHRDFRRMLCGNVDYLEAVHAVAEVPLPPRVKFYPSNNEIRQAQKRRFKMGLSNFVIVWAVSGSSVHKVWPYMDIIISRLMLSYDNVRVVLCGGGLDEILELGWEKEPRVKSTIGHWSIRESVAFAQQADLVIGPETGIMNAVALEPMHKILMLSHSGPGNIGKNWENTCVMLPERTSCYPCHILHRGFELCMRDEITGCAMCAANTDFEKVWDAMVAEIGPIKEGVTNEHLSGTVSEI